MSSQITLDVCISRDSVITACFVLIYWFSRRNNFLLGSPHTKRATNRKTPYWLNQTECKENEIHTRTCIHECKYKVCAHNVIDRSQWVAFVMEMRHYFQQQNPTTSKHSKTVTRHLNVINVFTNLNTRTCLSARSMFAFKRISATLIGVNN